MHSALMHEAPVHGAAAAMLSDDSLKHAHKGDAARCPHVHLKDLHPLLAYRTKAGILTTEAVSGSEH